MTEAIPCSRTVLVARPVWPVLQTLAEGLASRGYLVERSGSWDALFDVREAGEDLAAVFLGEYGEIAEEEEILRRFRKDAEGKSVPVFLVGGRNALRRERRFLEVGADQVFSAELSAADILERARPLHALGDMCHDAIEVSRELRRHSLVDELTGLSNRRHFTEELARNIEMARRIGRPLSCIVTDMDDMRGVNETHGFPVGDGVIRRFGEILKGGRRRYDAVARLGGDQFAWLLVGANAPQAVRAAWRVHRKVAESVFDGPRSPVRVTATWGVSSVFPGDESPERLLMENADRALYWGKESGKNTVRCYPPEKAAVDG